jgi:hypothetical protein
MWQRAAPLAKKQQQSQRGKTTKLSFPEEVLSPKVVMEFLIQWKSTHGVRVDAASLSIVLDVIAKGASDHQAPYLVMDFLEQVRQKFPEHCKNPFLFSQGTEEPI